MIDVSTRGYDFWSKEEVVTWRHVHAVEVLVHWLPPIRIVLVDQNCEFEVIWSHVILKFSNPLFWSIKTILIGGSQWTKTATACTWTKNHTPVYINHVDFGRDVQREDAPHFTQFRHKKIVLWNRESFEEKPEIEVPDCDFSHCFPSSDEIPAKLYSSPSSLFDYCYGQFIYPLILGRDFQLIWLFGRFNRHIRPLISGQWSENYRKLNPRRKYEFWESEK